LAVEALSLAAELVVEPKPPERISISRAFMFIPGGALMIEQKENKIQAARTRAFHPEPHKGQEIVFS
jgi:hypothetical protein